MIIRSATPEEIDAVALAMSYCPSRDVRSVAMFERGALLACVLYDFWTYNSVNMHVYSSTPLILNSQFLKEVFKYPFTHGRNVLIVTTPADSKDSLKFSATLGFKETYRVKDGWKEGIDLIVKEMRKHECRWVQEKTA